MLAGAALTLIALTIIYYARNVLLAIVKLALWLIVVWLAYNATTFLDVALPNAGWQPGFLLGAGVGFILVGVLSFRFIYNSLVEANRGRAHQGVDKTYDGQRI